MQNIVVSNKGGLDCQSLLLSRLGCSHCEISCGYELQKNTNYVLQNKNFALLVCRSISSEDKTQDMVQAASSF